jgi:prefoldin subunit 5
MNKITVEDLNKQRASLSKEIEDMNQRINQAFGAIRLIDFLIARENQKDEVSDAKNIDAARPQPSA